MPDEPVANFSFAQTPGSLDVQFTDTSTGGAPDSWFWDFGDGSTSTSPSPLHTYATDGDYEVKLITSNDGGTTSKTETVTVAPLAAGVPAASFTSLQTPATLKVKFTDTSTNTPTSWAWDFGDGGGGSTSQNPTHTYSAPGPYQVTLHATNDNGTGTTTKGIVVDPLPLPGATYKSVTPNRIVDSRSGKGLSTSLTSHVAESFQVTGLFPLPGDPRNVPANAVAITGNLTVTGQTKAGYFALTTTAENNPSTSTLNFPLGDNRANGVTVPLTATGGKLWITYAAVAGAKANAIFDVTGYFVPDASGATYKVIAPTRIVDTRTPLGLPGHLNANQFQTFNVSTLADGIPSDATAVTGNLTVTGQTAAGYFALGPDATDTPTTSTLNFPAHDTRANNVTVPLGPGQSLSVTYAAVAGAKAQVIFDVTGYFTGNTDGATYKVVTPNRILDSRPATRTPTGFLPLTANVFESFQVTDRVPLDTTENIPVGAVAVTGNLTVTGQTAAGFFALGPVGSDTPTTSTLNFPLGDTRANGVTLPIDVGPPGMLSVTYAAVAGHTAQVIFDVTGYFLP